jgi:hypothetical protein
MASEADLEGGGLFGEPGQGMKVPGLTAASNFLKKGTAGFVNLGKSMADTVSRGINTDVLRKMDYQKMLTQFPPINDALRTTLEPQYVKDASIPLSTDDAMAVEVATMFYCMHMFYLHTTKETASVDGYSLFMAEVTKNIYKNMHDSMKDQVAWCMIPLSSSMSGGGLFSLQGLKEGLQGLKEKAGAKMTEIKDQVKDKVSTQMKGVSEKIAGMKEQVTEWKDNREINLARTAAAAQGPNQGAAAQGAAAQGAAAQGAAAQGAAAQGAAAQGAAAQGAAAQGAAPTVSAAAQGATPGVAAAAAGSVPEPLSAAAAAPSATPGVAAASPDGEVGADRGMPPDGVGPLVFENYMCYVEDKAKVDGDWNSPFIMPDGDGSLNLATVVIPIEALQDYVNANLLQPSAPPSSKPGAAGAAGAAAEEEEEAEEEEVSEAAEKEEPEGGDEKQDGGGLFGIFKPNRTSYTELMVSFENTTVDALKARIGATTTDDEGRTETKLALAALFYVLHSWCHRASPDLATYDGIMDQLHYTIFDSTGVQLLIPRGVQRSLEFVDIVMVSDSRGDATTKRENPFFIGTANEGAEFNKNTRAFDGGLVRDTARTILKVTTGGKASVLAETQHAEATAAWEGLPAHIRMPPKRT